MAKASKYFVRSEDGQKGPFTLEQMRDALAAGMLSDDAEYRTDGEEAWQRIERLKAELGRREARARVRPTRPTPEPAAARGPAPAELTPKDKRAVALLLSLGGAFVVATIWWSWGHRDKVMGKPCRAVADCPGGDACVLLIDADRTIEPEGYCTLTCNGPSDCKSGMYCGDAAEIGPQGVKWDGMMGKNASVCLKR